MKLFNAFSEVGQKHAQKLAFTFLDRSFKSKTYTYGKLFEKVADVADNIRKLHLGRKTLVGLLMSSQEDQIIHYLAVLSCDLVPAILTPYNRKLNVGYYVKTMEKVIGGCGFNAIITDVDLSLAITVARPYQINKINNGTSSSEPVDAAFLQFSSGTTGIKKGVLVSDEVVLAQLQTYATTIGLNQNDCIISWLPLYHDMGFIACLNMPLLHGIHTVMIHPIDWVTDPSLYIKALSTFRGTLGWNPNFAYSFLADRVNDLQVDLSSVRILFNCSEPVTRESQNKFTSKYGPNGLNPNVFCGCYAMAETTFAITFGESTDQGYFNGKHVSVGRALPSVEVKIMDAGGEVKEGEIGEFWVKSPFNAFGYFRNQEASQKVFIDGWYCTGDLGYRIDDELFVCGRKKDLIIIGGVNFYPNDLEDIVNETPGVQPGRTVAFAIWDENLQTEQAVILGEANQENHAPIIMEIRKRLLSSFQISNFIVDLVPGGWLIKSSAGKIARAANKEKWLGERNV